MTARFVPDFYVAVNVEERVVVRTTVIIATVCQCLFFCLQRCVELTQDGCSDILVLRVFRCIHRRNAAQWLPRTVYLELRMSPRHVI